MTLGHSIRMLGATSLVAVLAVMGACLTGCSPSPTPAPSSAQTGTAASQNKTNASTHAQGTNIALVETNSIFEDKRPGARDPFFPTSIRGLVKPPPPQGQSVTPPPVAVPKPAVELVLVLRGILGGTNSRTALINNRIFRVGDEAIIRSTNAQARIKCLEIGQQSVTISVNGKPEPKTLYYKK